MSPLREYYVDISTSESSLEYICPVIPPREYYVDISSESSAVHDILSDSYWPKPQPAEFSGRNWAAAGRRPITVAGRTRPRSSHTWPHPFVSTRLL